MRRPWIKIEVATPDKPEICAIANRLKIDEDMVVGKLVRFWAWVAQNQVQGSNLGVTLDFIDRLVGRKGFAAALCQAGWLAEEDGNVSIPNFDRHNSTVARTRALTKTRVERHRKVTAQKTKKKATVVTKDERRSESPSKIAEGAIEVRPDEEAASMDVVTPEQAQTPEVVVVADESPAAAMEVTAEVVIEERTVEAADEPSELETQEERNDELSINAMPTFNALQSESVVENVMKGPPAELDSDESDDSAIPAKPEKPSKKKDDPFADQPLLF
jgi:hypothetical protein